jgi:hypothetical protein
MHYERSPEGFRVILDLTRATSVVDEQTGATVPVWQWRRVVWDVAAREERADASGSLAGGDLTPEWLAEQLDYPTGAADDQTD